MADKVGTLKSAAAEGKPDEVKRLIEEVGVPVDQPDEYGDTALHAAAQNGRNDIVKYLLLKGANPNARNTVGSTPLHKLFSSKYEQKNILKQLLKANADINIRNGAGKLPEEFVKNKGILIELLGDLAVSEEVDVPKSQHGRIIGKGGQKMTEIRDETHCLITVPEQKDPGTAVSVVGRQGGVARARVLIKEAIADRKSEESEEAADGLTTVRYPLPKEQHKLLIGKGGKTINEIRDETNVQIFVPKADDSDNTILLKGETDDITEAIKRINVVTRPRPVGEGRGGYGGSRGRGGYNNTERRNSDGRRGSSERRNSNDSNSKSMSMETNFHFADSRSRREGSRGGRGGGRGGNGEGGPSTTTSTAPVKE